MVSVTFELWGFILVLIVLDYSFSPFKFETWVEPRGDFLFLEKLNEDG